MVLVNAKEMLVKAQQGGYAVGQFNLNNMETVRAFLLAAQQAQSPIILGVTGAIADYMGGYKAISGMVAPFVRHLGVTVPVVLHADHSTLEQALEALESGFTSVMFDGSALPIEQNLEKTRRVIRLAKDCGASVEAEVGSISGEEDGMVSHRGECADPAECKRMANIGVDMLAAGIGNIHGNYPENWAGLSFDVLEAVNQATQKLPLVLHGGSGIPNGMIQKAIQMGVCKINVNTECQLAFTQAVRLYFEQGKDRDAQGFVMRKVFLPGLEAVREKAIEKMKLFGSAGKA